MLPPTSPLEWRELLNISNYFNDFSGLRWELRHRTPKLSHPIKFLFFIQDSCIASPGSFTSRQSSSRGRSEVRKSFQATKLFLSFFSCPILHGERREKIRSRPWAESSWCCFRRAGGNFSIASSFMGKVFMAAVNRLLDAAELLIRML